MSPLSVVPALNQDGADLLAQPTALLGDPRSAAVVPAAASASRSASYWPMGFFQDAELVFALLNAPLDEWLRLAYWCFSMAWAARPAPACPFTNSRFSPFPNPLHSWKP